MNTASWVTLSRLALLPVAAIAAASSWSYGLLMSAAACAVAGITDVVDGIVARRGGGASTLGANLDLLTDKAFVSVIMLVEAARGWIELWVPLVVIARETLVTAARWTRSRHQAPRSDAWGKAKMATSVVAIVGVLLWQDLLAGGVMASLNARVPIAWLLGLAPQVMLAAVALTLVSGLNYLARYLGPGRGGRPSSSPTGPRHPPCPPP